MRLLSSAVTEVALRLKVCNEIGWRASQWYVQDRYRSVATLAAKFRDADEQSSFIHHCALARRIGPGTTMAGNARMENIAYEILDQLGVFP